MNAKDLRTVEQLRESNGLAIKKLCERACHVFGQQEYARLATISVSHLYNLRRSPGYRRQRTTLDKTRSQTDPSTLPAVGSGGGLGLYPSCKIGIMASEV